MEDEKVQGEFDLKVMKMLQGGSETPIEVILPDLKKMLDETNTMNKDVKSLVKVNTTKLAEVVSSFEKADKKKKVKEVANLDPYPVGAIVVDALANDALTNSDSFWSDLKEEIDYAGFNRQRLIRSVQKLRLTNDQLTQIVATIAFRGPVKAASIKLKLLGNRTFIEVGISKDRAGPNEPDKLTANRLISLFPDLAAIGLKKMRAGKKIVDNPLPAWLQFPNAASLPMHPTAKECHRVFAEDFSKVIKGKFNSDIYQSVASNTIEVSNKVGAYLELDTELDTSSLYDDE
jgi:hypothetical protein